MRYSQQFGISAPDIGWVPAPTYILRRAAILELMDKYPRGRILEVGCGGGALLYDLAMTGFNGVGVESSVQAYKIASRLLAGIDSIEIVDRLPEMSEAAFDYLLSFEVLEHIKEDEEALSKWSAYLKPKGLFLVSVPAHHEKWSNSDVWAGHYRRYDRTDIVDKLEKAGFRVLSISCYGWPLSNLIEPIRSWVHGRRLKCRSFNSLDTGADMLKRTSQSGVERTVETRLYPLYDNWFGRYVFSSFISLQRLFFSTDLGTGYLVVAKKT